MPQYLLALWIALGVSTPLMAEGVNVEMRTFSVSQAGRDAAIASDSLGFHWPDTNSQDTYIYQGKLAIPPSQQEGQPLYMILPPIWCDFVLSINGKLFLSRKMGRIFGHEIAQIPTGLLAASNSVELKLTGNHRQCRVRGDALIVTDDSAVLARQRVANFALNDIHGVATALNIFLVLILVSILNLREPRQAIVALIMSLVAQIPYNLLASDFYRDWFPLADSSNGFYFQLVSQCVVWPAIILFYYLFSAHRARLKSHNFLYLIVSIFGVSAAMALASIYSRPIFHWLFDAYIFVCLICVVTLFLRMRSDPIFSMIYLLATLLFAVSFVSEIFSLNLYLLVHGWVLIDLLALFMIRNKAVNAHRTNEMITGIIAKFMPEPCYARLTTAIEKQVRANTGDDNKVIADASGHGCIATILIDICDWGIHSSYERSKVQSSLTNSARLETFSAIQEIATRHQIDFIKSKGDDLKYCAGLYFGQENREHVVATMALEFIVEIIESIDKINTKLRALSLPVFDIKVSACMGSNYYGIEQYLNRIQFDTIGHEVNIAYRLESNMDREFYEKFGKNVALVHENLIAHCSNKEILDKFKKTHIAMDKHAGHVYNCFVYAFEERQVKLADLTSGLSAFFEADKTGSKPRHEWAQVGPRNVPAVKDLENLDKRQLTREDVYLGENVLASLIVDGKEINTEIIDFSPRGLGLVCESYRGVDALEEGMDVKVRFSVVSQEFVATGSIKRIGEISLRGRTFCSIGVLLSPPDRSAMERANVRFAADPNCAPLLNVQSPFAFRKEVGFRVTGISNHGLSAVSLGSEPTGFLVGMKLYLTIFVPLVNKITCTGLVRYIDPGDGNESAVGFEVIEDLDKFQEAMGVYILQIGRGRLTLKDLRDEGFSIPSTKMVLSCCYKQDDEDLEQIKELRREAAKNLGMQAKEGSDDNLSDRFDAKARHIMIMHGERLVASCRVVFNSGDLEAVEHLSYGVQLPAWLMEQKFVEFSRACIAPDYRNSDAFVLLLYHLARVAIESGHDWVVISAHERLMNFYKRFGFEKIGTFQSEDGKSWMLGAANVKAIVKGRRFLPVGYTFGYEMLSQQLQEQGLIEPDLLYLINSGIMSAVKPLVLGRMKNAIKKSTAR